MEHLKQILTDHARRYPLMKPVDAVKLLYQNEFGGGHLIRNEAACTAYLRQEYEAVAQAPDAPLTEEIGNGLVRVNLKALDEHGYSPEMLATDFIRSAAVHTGSVDSFLIKLDILRHVVREGHFHFPSEELEQYLDCYAQAGYPMVSHSDIYRSAYGPAYRIVLEQFLNNTKNV